MLTRTDERNACLRHKDSSYACWVFKDGAANYEAVQTTQQGGTCFLVFRYSLYLLYWYNRCIYLLYILYIYPGTCFLVVRY